MVIIINYEKKAILITIQKRFFVKHIVLIFSLIRSAALLSYNSIMLIFSLVRITFFLVLSILVYIKWFIVNIVQIAINLKKLLSEQ